MNDHVLVALPHAGGGTALYRDWPDHLPRGVELLPVRLAGRESRADTPAYDRMELVVADVVAAVADRLSVPGTRYSLVGHSMGALLAYELAYALPPATGREPDLLVVAGRRAVQLGSRSVPDEAELREQLRRRLRAAGADRYSDDELRPLVEVLLPTLAADTAVVATYRYRPRPPLRCPLLVLAGEDDPATPREELAGWSTCTTAPTEIRRFPGDHFFLESNAPAVARAVAARLCAVHSLTTEAAP